MASNYDATEFIDGDFEMHKNPYSAPQAAAGQTPRAPTREEVDSRVSETQQRLAELKRAQEQLERERSALEETRRRQSEFQAGRQEMIQNLTRGVGLIEEAEFNSRREAEQMAKALTEMREALSAVQAIREETWTQEDFSVSLTRALTTLENARMEWNSARLKFPMLAGETPATAESVKPGNPNAALPWTQMPFGELCKVGLALTWPLAVVALAALGVMLAVILRH